MKILLIAAMDKEVRLLRSLMPDCEEKTLNGVHGYAGNIGDKEVFLSKCGIGKVNAALNTYRIIESFDPELVINSGVAGGVDAGMHIGDVLIADAVAYHDVWCGPGTQYGAADGYDAKLQPYIGMSAMAEEISKNNKGVHYGLLASGDKFISTVEEVDEIKSHFPEAMGCDMESGAIAQTCEMCGVPFIVVRVLSDRPGSGDNVSEYENFWDNAPELTFNVVKSVIERI